MESLCAQARCLAVDLHALLHAFDCIDRAGLSRHARAIERLAERLQALLRVVSMPGDPRRALLLEPLLGVHRVVEEVRSPSQVLDWAAFRRRAALAYEALAAGLRRLRVRVPSLRPRNYVRNIFHCANGLVALACVELLPGRTAMIVAAGAFLAFAWTMEIGRRASERWGRFAIAMFRPVIHPHEHTRVNSATWYVTALFLLAVFAPVASCALGVAVLGFADPAAAVVGRRFGRVRVRAGRSLEGTATFAAVGFGAAITVLSVFHPALAGARVAALAVTAALAGAIAELYSGPLDDNFTIPVAVAAATWPLLAMGG